MYAIESGRVMWPQISEKLRQNIKVAMAGLNSKQVDWDQLDLAVRQNDRVICYALSKRLVDMKEMVDSQSFVKLSPKKTDHLQCVAISSGAMKVSELEGSLSCQVACCALRGGLDWKKLSSYTRQTCDVGRCGSKGQDK